MAVMIHKYTHTHTLKKHTVFMLIDRYQNYWFMDSLQLTITLLFYSWDSQVSIPLLLQPLHMKTIST